MGWGDGGMGWVGLGGMGWGGEGWVAWVRGEGEGGGAKHANSAHLVR